MTYGNTGKECNLTAPGILFQICISAAIIFILGVNPLYAPPPTRVDITNVALSDSTASAVNVTYSITFTLATALAAADSIIITIPADANVSGAGSPGTILAGGGNVSFDHVVGQDILLVTDGPVNAGVAHTLQVTGIQNQSTAKKSPPGVKIDMITKNSAGTIDNSDDNTPVPFPIKGKLTLHAGGAGSQYFPGPGTATQHAIFSFGLTAVAEDVRVTNIIFNLSTLTGVSAADIANAAVFVDANGDGNKDAGDVTQVGGAGVITAGPDIITFSNLFNHNEGTVNYILTADVSNLEAGDKVGVSLSALNITAEGKTSQLALIPTGLVPEKLNLVPDDNGNGGNGGGENGDDNGENGNHGEITPTMQIPWGGNLLIALLMFHTAAKHVYVPPGFIGRSKNKIE